MKTIDTTETISVNPGEKTLGKSNNELAYKLFRNSILENKTDRKIDFISLVLPSNKSGIELLEKYYLPLRTIFAALLIISGIQQLEGTFSILNYNVIGIIEICLGAFLAFGLFSRLFMGISIAFYLILGIVSMRLGLVNLYLFVMMFGSSLFFAMGSGKYSCDTLIKKALIIKKRKNEIERNNKRMSYKAFYYATK